MGCYCTVHKSSGSRYTACRPQWPECGSPSNTNRPWIYIAPLKCDVLAEREKWKDLFGNRVSWFGITTRLRAERPGFDFRQEHEIFLFSIASRLAPGPTQPPIQWIPRALSLGVKRQGRESDHSPTSSTKAMNGVAIPPLPRIPSWHSA
jgi:hypothetical protein